MQEVVRILSENPLAALAICFAGLLFLFFSLKKLVKLVLIMIIVAVAIGGYYYFREPGSKPADLKGAVEKARLDAGRAVEKGRELFDRGKEAIEKGREMVDKGKEVLDAGIEKGNEAVDKGKGAAGEIGKILGGEREAGKN